MHRDRDLNDSELKALPRYQLAARHERLLRDILVACLLIVLGLFGILRFALLPGLQSVMVVQAAALLVLTASLQSVWWISRWRHRALMDASQLPYQTGEDANSSTLNSPNSTVLSDPPFVSPSRFAHFRIRLSARGLTFLTFIKNSGLSLGTLGTVLFAGVALALVINYWAPNPSTAQANAVQTRIVQPSLVQQGAVQPGVIQSGVVKPQVIGQIPVKLLVVVGLVVAAFAALVIERHFAHLYSQNSTGRTSALPEAPHIAYQLRVYITLSLLLSAALLLVNVSRQWPLDYIIWLGVLPAAIAGEFLLRAALSVFSPPQQHEPQLLTKSLLAALWRWPIKPFTHLQDELKQRFGIDLRQSWAFAYIQRSLLSVTAVLLGIAWLLSGLVEIPMAERGIYERFGAPVAIWQPGIHAGLPWPFGKVQRMENGVVHELSATSNEPPKELAATRDSVAQVRTELENIPSAEGVPPPSANRLWDASHLAEKSQIIASEVTTTEGNRQSFHIVNMDVRFMYRIGLTDEAVLDARYTSADAPALIRSTANRILVRYFASRTLEGVLGEARTQMAREIGTQLQADLDSLNSGVEIMTTVLEAIHPPAAAANAYHAVQAAQIKAHAIISRERGSAAQQVNLAQLRAELSRNQASATARETLATAEVANRRFVAERDAYQQGGKAFLMEQYFAQLTQGLKNARVLLVDHRLPNTGATIDLRDFAAGDKKAGVSPALAPTADYQESP